MHVNCPAIETATAETGVWCFFGKINCTPTITGFGLAAASCFGQDPESLMAARAIGVFKDQGSVCPFWVVGEISVKWHREKASITQRPVRVVQVVVQGGTSAGVADMIEYEQTALPSNTAFNCSFHLLQRILRHFVP